MEQTGMDDAAGELAALSRLLASQGERIGACLFALLADDARRRAHRRAAVAAAAVAEQEHRQARVLLQVAAELDGAAVALDGGPSALGAAEWVGSFRIAAQDS